MTTLRASVTSPSAEVPSARQFRVRLRRMRRGHHDGSLGDFLTDLYILALCAVMYGWGLIANGREFLRSPWAGGGDPAERYWLCVAAALAVAGLVWQGLRAVGPLFVTPAAQTWAASAPIDRRAWLLPRFGVLLAGAAIGVAALGLIAAAVTASGQAADLAWAGLAGATCGVGGAALSVVAQSTRHGRRWSRLPGTGLTGAGVVVAAVVVGSHFAGGRLDQPTMPPIASIAAAGLPLAAVAIILAARALPRADRAALTTGTQIATAAVTAALWMDTSLISGAVEARRWRGIGRVRSRRFRSGGRWWALLQAELRRLHRHPSAVAAWAALAIVQYAVAVALPMFAGPAQVIGAYFAADRLTGGLRAVSRAPGLRRSLGGGDNLLRVVHLIVPAIGAILWWLITAPVGGALPGWVEGILVAGVVGAIYRAATRSPMSYGGPVVETPFGLIPVDLLRQVFRGPDVVAVLVIVQIVLA